MKSVFCPRAWVYRPDPRREKTGLLWLLAIVLCLSPVVATAAEAAQASPGASVTVLVLDVSGSMNDPDQSGVPKVEAARTSAANLLTVIEQDNVTQQIGHSVGLATFANSASLLVDPSTDVDAVEGELAQLMANGGTNIGAGLDAALNTLEAQSASVPRYIILMTDGKPTDGLLSLSEFVAGPVARARTLGVCIYTVGFGTVGNLDEDLLRGIAHESGCGEYYFADTEYRLGVIYSRVRHQTMGEFVQNFNGTIGQDETKELGTYNVNQDQAQADFTLWWPGSVVELILTDTAGKQVASGYPGAQFFEGPTMRRILVDQPVPGPWRIATYGREVPEGTIEVDVIASTTPLAPPEPGAGGAGLVFVLVVLAGTSVGMYLFSRAQRSRARGTSKQARRQPASMLVLHGSGSGQRIPLLRNAATIGCAQTSTVYLNDPGVSPQHATLRFNRGRWYLYDEQSPSGTFVNGMRVQAVALNPGDRIVAGSAELQFVID